MALRQLNNYVPVIEAFYTYNFLVGYGEWYKP